MDKKQEMYGIYVGLLRIHKEFADKFPYRAEQEEFIKRINILNAQYNTLFCYMMCEALRKWSLKKFDCMVAADISRYYSDIWHFHKEWIGKEKTDEDWEVITKEANAISSVWGLSGCEDMVLAIVAELDVSSKPTNSPQYP